MNSYVSSCNAYCLWVALYGLMSQPSSQLDIFWLKLVVFLECNPSTPVVWTVELYLPFLPYSWNNLVVVLRASGSLRYELRRVAVEYILYVYASVHLQGLVVRHLAWKRPVFRGTLSVSSQNLSKKLGKRNASGSRDRGSYIDGIRAKVLRP